MSAPTYGTLGTLFSGSTSTPAFAVPAGVAAGDVIVVAFYAGGGTTTITSMAAGFAYAENSPRSVNSGGTGQHSLHVAWKRATGNDTGTYSFTLSGSVFVYGNAHRVPGCVASGNPWDTPTGAADGGNSILTTAPPVSITTGGPDRLIFYTASDESGDGGTWSPPAGLTQQQGGANTTNCEVATVVQAVQGGTGSLSATTTAGGADRMGAWVGALVGTTSASEQSAVQPQQLPPHLVALLAARAQRLYDTTTGTPPTSEGGSAVAALTAGPATAGKIAQVSGRAGLALAGGGSARKLAASAGTGELALRGTATAAKTATTVARGVFGLAGTAAESTSTSRPQAGSALLAAGGTAAAGKIALCAGRASTALTGAGASRKTAIPAGRATTALTGGSAARKTATAAGRSALELAGIGAATKRASPGGRSELVLVGVGTVSPTGARPQTGRCVIVLSAHLAHQCTTARLSTGTTTRGSSGIMIRPDTGVTEAPC